MQRIPVESSDVVAIGYDPKRQTLEIEFHEGRIYEYTEVPQDVYDHFMRADSYGNYFNTYINKRYKYTRVTEDTDKATHDTLAFVTGNSRKFRNFERLCASFDIPVEQLALPVEEIQSASIDEVIKHKAKRAYALAGRPVAVNDTFWNILALRGFPGAYMKDVTEWLHPEDFLALMADKNDRTITCTEAGAYYDGTRLKQFTKTHTGTIIDEPRGEGLSIVRIVVMQGQTQTIAEIENMHAMGSIVPEETAMYEVAKWYALQRKIESFKRK